MSPYRLVRIPTPTAPAPRRAVDRRTPTLPLPRVPEPARGRGRLPADVERTAERLDLALSGRLRAPGLLTVLTPGALGDLRAAHALAAAAGDTPCPKRQPACGPVERCAFHDAALRAWWDVLHPAAWVITRGGGR